jgi:hypothetical protein
MQSGLTSLQKTFPEVSVENYENRIIVNEQNLEIFMKYIQTMFPVKHFPEYAYYKGDFREKLLQISRDEEEFLITRKSRILIAKK